MKQRTDKNLKTDRFGGGPISPSLIPAAGTPAPLSFLPGIHGATMGGKGRQNNKTRRNNRASLNLSTHGHHKYSTALMKGKEKQFDRLFPQHEAESPK